MRCPKCNSKIEDEANVCRYCQYVINESEDLTVDREGLYDNSSLYSKYSTKESSREPYRDKYIGKNKNIINLRFNIFAFIFGPFYLIYRNIYKIGIFTLILYLFLIKEPIVILIINLVLGFEFRTLYYTDMDYKIKNILKDNPDKSNKELMKLIEEKGNVNNILKLLILIVGFMILVFLIYTNYVENVIKKEESGILLRVSFDKLDYKIPNRYKLISDNDNYKAYDNNSDDNKCIFSVSSRDYKYYKDEIDYIKSVDNIDKVNKKEINNNIWYNYSIDNKDIYVIKKDDYFYKVIFSTYKNSDSVCLNDKNDLINSLKFEGV